MGYEPVVNCRQCNGPCEVYQPFETRFCCEECEDYYYNGPEQNDCNDLYARGQHMPGVTE